MYRIHRVLAGAAGLMLALGVAAPAHAEGKAHSHGLATLDVAVDGRQITIDLETPLDNLVGFERAPRTEAERKRVDAAVQRLRQAAQMFAIDPAAQCTSVRTELTSAVLGLGQPAAAATTQAGKVAASGKGKGKGQADQDEHAELDASYVFECAQAGQAAHIDIGLFEFANLARLQVQAVTAKGQFKRTLTKSARRLVLAR